MVVFTVLTIAIIGVAGAVPLTKRLDREWDKRHDSKHDKRPTASH